MLLQPWQKQFYIILVELFGHRQLFLNHHVKLMCAIFRLTNKRASWSSDRGRTMAIRWVRNVFFSSPLLCCWLYHTFNKKTINNYYKSWVDFRKGEKLTKIFGYQRYTNTKINKLFIKFNLLTRINIIFLRARGTQSLPYLSYFIIKYIYKILHRTPFPAYAPPRVRRTLFQ